MTGSHDCSDTCSPKGKVSDSLPFGFTLVELLVVVAIIAILAALLMPSLRSARESARAISCMNNLKQLGTAMACYGQDNGEVIGPWDSSNTPTTPWMQILEPYLGGRTDIVSYVTSKIWSCPSNPAANGWDAGGNLAFGGSQYYFSRLSYLPNAAVLPKVQPFLRMGQARNASSLILAVEHNLSQVTGGNAGGTDYRAAIPNPLTGITTAYFGHRRGMNVLLCDYHMEYWPIAHPAFSGVVATVQPYWTPKQ